jgi:hypothetical protein
MMEKQAERSGEVELTVKPTMAVAAALRPAVVGVLRGLWQTCCRGGRWG